jgi:hypothetical protein
VHVLYNSESECYLLLQMLLLREMWKICKMKSVPAVHKSRRNVTTKTRPLLIFSKIVAVYCEKQVNPINGLLETRRENVTLFKLQG